MKKMSILSALLALCCLCACGSDNDNNGIDIDTNISISPNTLHVASVGETCSLEVKANREWAIIATNMEDWVTLSPASGMSGNHTVQVTVKPNNTQNTRNMEIVLKAGAERQYVKLTQDAPMQLSASTVYSLSAGQTTDIHITAAADWEAKPNADWISTQKADAQTLLITTTANEAFSDREGQVEITCGAEHATIIVHQGGADDRNVTVPMEGYHLVWHDEFGEGPLLNATTWRHEVQNSGWVNHELQNYVNHTSPEGQLVTEVYDGKLKINCFKENGKVYSGRVYAMQNTGWQYGYVEAKIKLPSGKGTWPAFWMMPVHFNSWPHDGEIDIMEEVGYHPNYVSSSLHADGHVHVNNTQVTKEVFCDGAEGEFHTYGMEWTADYFQFYVDGKNTLYYANPGTGVRDWPYDAPFYVILNLAWGGDWGGSQGVNEAALPVTMEVDWVRVWQK